MSKAQQAAEERWPSYPAVVEGARVTFLEGVAWALSEVPDDAVIEAMAKALFAIEEPDMNAFRWDREHPTEGLAWHDYWLNAARAAYAALRGAMQ